MAQIVRAHTVPNTLYVNNYVDQKGLAAMLTIKMSVGVAPMVNLRNPLHTGEKTCEQRIDPSFETQGRHHHKQPQKELMSSKFFLKSGSYSDAISVPL